MQTRFGSYYPQQHEMKGRKPIISNTCNHELSILSEQNQPYLTHDWIEMLINEIDEAFRKLHKNNTQKQLRMVLSTNRVTNLFSS